MDSRFEIAFADGSCGTVRAMLSRQCSRDGRILLALALCCTFLPVVSGRVYTHPSQLPGEQPTANTHYRITDLGTLGGKESFAKAINNRSLVVGDAAIANDSLHCFLWEEGKMLDLGSGESAGINNFGQVIIGPDSEGRPPEFHSYLWNKGNRIQLGNSKDMEVISPKSINDSGQVVGNSAYSQAMLWDRGRVQFLQLPFKTLFIHVACINNRGQMAGDYTLSPKPTSSYPKSMEDSQDYDHAVLWHDGNFQIIPAIREATALNDKGQVVGWEWSGWERRRPTRYAVLWENGRASSLGPRGPDIETIPAAINNQGQVVGSSSSHEGTVDYAFLWQQGQMMDLNHLIPGESHWLLTQANGINDHGQIVGEGTHYGKRRAFLLDPRP